jgi:hypothetical protein
VGQLKIWACRFTSTISAWGLPIDYLSHFPLALKIDQSFIANMQHDPSSKNHQAIVNMTLLEMKGARGR